MSPLRRRGRQNLILISPSARLFEAGRCAIKRETEEECSVKAITLIENTAPEGLTCEYGLSLYVEHGERLHALSTGLVVEL